MRLPNDTEKRNACKYRYRGMAGNRIGLGGVRVRTDLFCFRVAPHTIVVIDLGEMCTYVCWRAVHNERQRATTSSILSYLKYRVSEIVLQ